MAVAGYSQSDEDKELEVKSSVCVKGPLRILAVPEMGDDTSTFVFQVDPYGDCDSISIMTSVEELIEAAGRNFSFDDNITSVLRGKREGDKTALRMDELEVMKNTRRCAAEVSKLFREFADRLDKEIPQYDAYIEQEEKERDLNSLPFIAIPDELRGN